MIILMLMFLFSGGLLAVLFVPLIMGKIPPNGLYGFRVKKTMEDPDIWYPVNRYGGKWLLAAGLVLALAAVGLFFVPGISLDGYSYSVLAVWVAIFTIAMVVSFRYMNLL